MLDYLIELYYSLDTDNPELKRLIDQLLILKEIETLGSSNDIT